MSTLKERKKTQEEESKPRTSNDWLGFVKDLLKIFIQCAIYLLVGSGILYAVNHLNDDVNLPSDINKPPYNPERKNNLFKTFPYVHYNNKNATQMVSSLLFPSLAWDSSPTTGGQVFSRTIASSMSSTRGLLSGLLAALCPGYDGDTKKNVKYTCSESNSLIEHLMVAFSPLLVVLLVIIPAIPLYSAYEGFKTFIFMNASPILKFFMLIPIYFLLGFTGLYQLIYPALFFIYSGYRLFKDGKATQYIKSYKFVYYTAIAIALISSSTSSLTTKYATIVSIVAIIPYFFMLYKILIERKYINNKLVY